MCNTLKGHTAFYQSCCEIKCCEMKSAILTLVSYALRLITLNKHLSQHKIHWNVVCKIAWIPVNT